MLSSLKEGSDIEGAVLVEGKSAIIACDLPENKNYEAEIPGIMALLEKGNDSALNENHKRMFAQCILDYDNCKIIIRRLKDRLTLLVMLHKQGYISLATLEIENSIKKIAEILQGCQPKRFYD